MYVAEQEDSPPVLFELSSCTICMQRLETDIATIKCGHVFHEECIRKCIRLSSKQCPVCKRRIQSEAEVNRLFLNYQENGKIELQLQKILDDLQTADVGANAFDRAIIKLRTALKQNKQLQQKLDKTSTEYVALQGKFEDFVVGVKHMEDQIKESNVIRRRHQKKIKQLEERNSFIEGMNQNYERTIVEQLDELKNYHIFQKSQKDIDKDNNYFDLMRKKYLHQSQTTGSSEGVQYFSQLAGGLKLDIKRLQKDNSNSQAYNRQLLSENKDLNSELNQCKQKYQKQSDLNKVLKQKYARLHDKAYKLLAKLNQKRIQTDIVLEEDTNSRGFINKQSQIQKPKLLSNKDIVSNKPIEKNLFSDIGFVGVKRIEKKKSNFYLNF